MNVYAVRHDSDLFEWLTPAGRDGNEWLKFTQFAVLGNPAAEQWSPLNFRPQIHAEVER